MIVCILVISMSNNKILLWFYELYSLLNEMNHIWDYFLHGLFCCLRLNHSTTYHCPPWLIVMKLTWFKYCDVSRVYFASQEMCRHIYTSSTSSDDTNFCMMSETIFVQYEKKVHFLKKIFYYICKNTFLLT